MTSHFDIRHYTTANGRDVIGDYLSRLRDARGRARIVARISRLEDGNFGDAKFVRDGVYELRIHYGPGYRVYYGVIALACVLLLCAGDKQSQPADIERAVAYLREYQKAGEENGA
ncbi:MAG: type II toxin-antitoxin system RelE/ParE family toxin [Terriglobales bacterium]